MGGDPVNAALITLLVTLLLTLTALGVLTGIVLRRGDTIDDLHEELDEARAQAHDLHQFLTVIRNSFYGEHR